MSRAAVADAETPAHDHRGCADQQDHTVDRQSAHTAPVEEEMHLSYQKEPPPFVTQLQVCRTQPVGQFQATARARGTTTLSRPSAAFAIRLI